MDKKHNNSRFGTGRTFFDAVLTVIKRLMSNKRLNRRLISILACVVVFITTYALILPAITLTKADQTLVCVADLHEHDESCFEDIIEDGKVVGKKLICGYAGYTIHEHNSDCYTEIDGQKILVCELPEISAHIHSAECYEDQKVLTCGLEEGDGHKHSDSCYKEEKALKCEKDEHAHTDDCYEDGELVCGKEEHQHSSDCYEAKKTLTCKVDEGEGAHKHSDKCYGIEKVLTCEKLELHKHTTDCYEKGHSGDAAYLTCGKLELVEHTHGAACFTDKKQTDEQKIEAAEEAAEERLAKAESLESVSEYENVPEGIVESEEETAEAVAEQIAEIEKAADDGTESKAADSTNIDDNPVSDNTDKSSSEVKGIVDDESRSDYPAQTFEAMTDTMSVQVIADEGTFPKDTSMNITDIEDEDTIETILNSVDGSIRQIHAVDITFKHGDSEIEPLKPVKVIMTPMQSVESLDDPQIVHVEGTGATSIIDVADDVVKDEAIEKTDSLVADEAVVFEAESFSVYALVYTVDFAYSVNGEMYDFSLPGGEKIALSDLIEVLGIIRGTQFSNVEAFLKEVDDVTFSDPELVRVVKAEEDTTLGQLSAALGLDAQISADIKEGQTSDSGDKEIKTGDWALISLKAFDTEESLTITMKNGDVVTVKVTDAQIKKTVMTATGETWEIAVTYDEIAGIPDGADLEVSEIEPGSEDYEKYCEETHSALSEENYALRRARFFDIKIIADGQVIEPLTCIDIQITYVQGMLVEENQDVAAVHFAESGLEILDAEAEIGQIGGESIADTFTFSQDSLSVVGTIVKELNEGWPEPNKDGNREIEGNYYAIILTDTDGKHYALRSDGQLTEVSVSGASVTFQDISSTDELKNYEWQYKEQAISGGVTGGDTAGGGKDYHSNVRGNYLRSGVQESADSHYINPTANTEISYATEGVEGTRTVNGLGTGFDSGISLSLENGKIYYTVDGTKTYLAAGSDLWMDLTTDAAAAATVSFATHFEASDSGQASEGGDDGEDIIIEDVDLAAPASSKVLADNEDGTYTLSLNITGVSESRHANNMVDVVIVFDTSGSMLADAVNTGNLWGIMGNNGHSNRRDTIAQNALKSLVTELLSNNPEGATVENAPVRLSLLSFDRYARNEIARRDANGAIVTPTSGTRDLSTDNSWTINESLLNDTIIPQMDGQNRRGTNWEAALQLTDSVLETAREGAGKYVIFISDGNPSHHNTDAGYGDRYYYERNDSLGYIKDTQGDATIGSGGTILDGGSSGSKVYDVLRQEILSGYPAVYGTRSDTNDTNVRRCYDLALDDVRKIVAEDEAEFYSIGIYGSATRMESLLAYAYSGNNIGTYPANHYFSANNSAGMLEAFKEIITDISKNFGYADAELTDVMTTDVTAKTVVNGRADGFMYTVSNGSDVLYTVKATGDEASPEVNFTIGGTTYGGVLRTDTETVTLADGTQASRTYRYYEAVDADGNAITYTEGTGANAVTKTYKMCLADINASGEISWDLSGLGLLDNYTYTVSFIVWPDQDAYDYVAGLNNGLPEYTWDESGQVAIYDASGNLKFYESGVSQYPSIVKYPNGVFAVLTNKSQQVTYTPVTETTSSSGTTTVVYGETKTTDLLRPEPMGLTGSHLQIQKSWEDSLDPQQLLDLIKETGFNEDGTPKYSVTLDVMSGTKPYKSYTFSPVWDEESSKYIWTAQDLYIAPGIMVSANRATATGLDTTGMTAVTYYDENNDNKGTYYILEAGHDYSIVEKGTDYHFEFTSDSFHPMLVDGVLTNVDVHYENGNPKTITTIGTPPLVTFEGNNSLKGGILIYKDVAVDEDAITQLDQTPFTIKVTMKNPDGTDYGISDQEGGYRIVYGENNPNRGSAYRDSEGNILNYGRSSRQPISGGTFTVQIYAGDYIQVANVNTGVTYEAEELNIPTGYVLEEYVYSHETHAVTANTSHQVRVKNSLASYDLTILKTSQDASTPLPGAKFALYGANYYRDNGTVNTDALPIREGLKSGTDGKISLGKVAGGTYYLVETSAPAGYNMLVKPVKITIDGTLLSDVQKVSYVQDGFSGSVSGTGRIIEEVKDDRGQVVKYKYTLTVINTTGYELPSTGGPGTKLFTIIGSILVVSAGILLIRCRRRV